MLKEKLVETFPEQLEASIDFKLGYFERPGNSKRWIGTNEDLIGMYGCFLSNENTITLWCEGKKDESQKAHTEKRKGRCMEDCSEPISKRAKKDEDIDATFQKLHDKHSEDYSDPQLRLWARMCVNAFHDDFDTPPNVPAITGQPVRRKRGDHAVQPLIDALTGAATAITRILVGSHTSPTKSSSSNPGPKSTCGISPASKANLYLQQVRMLQQLREDGALSEEELLNRLCNIKSLN